MRYRDLGSMATIARFKGVAKIGRIEIAGSSAGSRGWWST